MKTANHDQVEYWNNSEATGDWVTYQDRYDRMLEPFARLILDAAGLAPGEQVLDVGCGCGATTLAAARAVAPGAVAGIDLSAAMLARARENAARTGLVNVSFEQADAQVHQIGGRYDAVISRFGVLFFADPVAAFANLLGAAKPGGRLAFACWQPLPDNEWLLVPLAALAEHLPLPDPDEPGAPGMFSLSSTDRLRQVLSDAGWRDVSAASQRTPILIGGGGTLDDAVSYLRARPIVRRMLADVGQATQDRAVTSMRDALARHVDGDGVRLNASIWVVTAKH